MFFFFFKRKTAYEGGTGGWGSDVCGSDLERRERGRGGREGEEGGRERREGRSGG